MTKHFVKFKSKPTNLTKTNLKFEPCYEDQLKTNQVLKKN